MTRVPTEPEIRSFAEKIGAVDDTGRYTEPRAKLAKGAAKYAEELSREGNETPRAPASTAAALVAFRRELLDSDIPADQIGGLLAAAAASMIRRSGLILRGEVAPDERPQKDIHRT